VSSTAATLAGRPGRLPRRRLAPALAGALAGAVALVPSPPAAALTPVAALGVSADTAVTLGGSTAGDEDLLRDDLAGGVSLALGGLPAPADLAAYHLDFDGAHLLVFDVTVGLPGAVTATPRDVVRWNGSAYTILLAGAAAGIPNGAAIDALSRGGAGLVLSFDIDTAIGGVDFADEDLVRYQAGAFTMLFDGSGNGIDPALDVDALDVLPNGRLLLSLDGSGSIAGLAFDDEDVLEVGADGAGWQLAYDGSSRHAGWAGADLDALAALAVELFRDGFETGFSPWSAVTP